MAFGSSPIVLALDAFPLSFFPSLVVYLARVFSFYYDGSAFCVYSILLGGI